VKQLLSIALLLFSSAVLLAQNSANSPEDASGKGTGSAVSIQGCLSGSDGNYTLTDHQGTAYQLSGDTSKLSAHVGHEVKITGTTGSSSATADNGMANSTPAAQTLQVDSMKHISKTCEKSSGDMSH
jgi:hypothetical protein